MNREDFRKALANVGNREATDQTINQKSKRPRFRPALIAAVVLAAAVLAAGIIGVYAYKSYVEQNQQEKKVEPAPSKPAKALAPLTATTVSELFSLDSIVIHRKDLPTDLQREMKTGQKFSYNGLKYYVQTSGYNSGVIGIRQISHEDAVKVMNFEEFTRPTDQRSYTEEEAYYVYLLLSHSLGGGEIGFYVPAEMRNGQVIAVFQEEENVLFVIDCIFQKDRVVCFKKVSLDTVNSMGLVLPQKGERLDCAFDETDAHFLGDLSYREIINKIYDLCGITGNDLYPFLPWATPEAEAGTEALTEP